MMNLWLETISSTIQNGPRQSEGPSNRVCRHCTLGVQGDTNPNTPTGRHRLEVYGHCMFQATVEGFRLWHVVNGGSYDPSAVFDERHVQMFDLAFLMQRGEFSTVAHIIDITILTGHCPAAICIEAERYEKECFKALLRKMGQATGKSRKRKASTSH